MLGFMKEQTDERKDTNRTLHHSRHEKGFSLLHPEYEDMICVTCNLCSANCISNWFNVYIPFICFTRSSCLVYGYEQ